MSKTLIYVAGPTGIGKTSLSIELAKKLKTDIISCDSRQFYKELKIGTSPPSNKQLKEVKHYFIHNRSVIDDYSVGDYEKDSIDIITQLFKQKDYLQDDNNWDKDKKTYILNWTIIIKKIFYKK